MAADIAKEFSVPGVTPTTVVMDDWNSDSVPEFKDIKHFIRNKILDRGGLIFAGGLLN